MSTFAEDFKSTVDTVLEDRLNSTAQRELVVSALMTAFADIKKKPVSDLELRLKNMEERLRLMVKSVTIGFVNGRLVVKVTGTSESLLKELRHGSYWYEPWEKVDELLLAAIMTDPPK